MTVRDAYKQGGFNEVWRWAKGRGKGRWLTAKRWAGKTARWFGRSAERRRDYRKQVWSHIMDVRNDQKQLTAQIAAKRKNREEAAANENWDKAKAITKEIDDLQTKRELARRAEKKKLGAARKVGRAFKDAMTERRARWNAFKVYRRKLRLVRKRIESQTPDPVPSGMVTPDRSWNPYDKVVCGWMVPWIDKIDAAGWGGTIVSGVRTPEYSVQLCYGICGAPACPGLCAGVNSNHNATTCAYPQGALDVSDYWNFAAAAQRVGAPLRNNLPSDRVHFSVSGG